MRLLTWDTGILAALGLLLAYSLLLRRHKSLAMLVSVYIAYLVTAAYGGNVAQFFAGQRVVLKSVWIASSASPFLIEAIFMVVVTFLLSLFLKLGSRKSKYSILEVVLYSVSTLALGVMFIISFMPLAMRDQAFEASKILPVVYQLREWILGVPVLFMIFFGMYKNEE